MTGEFRFKLTFHCAAFLTVLVAVGAYWPSLNGEFVFDDTEAIVNNGDVLPKTPLLALFSNDFWGKPLTSNRSHKSYRPLTVLTFRVNYYLSGGLHPWGFHLFNIVLHATVCVLLLVVFCVILRRRFLWDEYPPTAFHATLLFAVSPVHAENVAGIVGRADMLCAFFFFIAFIVYTKWKKILKESTSDYFSRTLLLASFIVATVCSMLCKEQGITILGVAFVHEVLCLTEDYAKRSNEGKKLTPVRSGRVKMFVLSSFLLSLLGLVMLLGRFWIMGGSLPSFQEVDNPSSFASSWVQRVVNFNYIYCINVWLLVYPHWLCFDWSMGCIPLIESIVDPRLLAIFVFWGFTSALLYECALEWRDMQSRSLILAVTFIAMPFLPASNLFVRVGFVLAERVLYISSAGFCLLISLGCRRLYSTIRMFNVILVLSGLCLLVFFLRCSQRSRDWLTEKSLFSSALTVCPLNAKVHYNIAKNVGDAGDTTLALEKYAEALRLHPEYDQAMNNMANILKDLGQLEEAEVLLEKAVQIRPSFAAAWMNLGIVQASLNKHHLAEHSYFTALSHRHHYPDCYYNLGNLYLAVKKYTEAHEAWLKAIQQKPTHAVSWNNMIIMFDNTGDLNKAKALGKEAVEILSNDASIHFNLANILGKLGEFKESEKHFLEAIRENDKNPTYFANLGVLYHRWKKFPEAEKAYRKALLLNPSTQSAKDNLDLLLQSWHREKHILKCCGLCLVLNFDVVTPGSTTPHKTVNLFDFPNKNYLHHFHFRDNLNTR